MSKNFPSHPHGQITPMVIAGGHKNSATGTSERQDGSAPIFDPMRMSQQDVNLEDMWFSGMSVNPSSFGQNSSISPPDPGTIVWVLKQMGEPGGIILGQSNTVRGGGNGSGGGGSDLMSGPILQQLQSEKIPVNIPPKISPQVMDGATIMGIQEKGEQHSLDLLDGLPVHGALFQMAGFAIPELKKIPTAKQTNDKMMDFQMMQQLMQQIMSMSQMFQSLANKKSGNGKSFMDNINGGLSPQMQTAMASLATLSQGMDSGQGFEFVTGQPYHEETFLNNSANLLSQVTTVDDLMNTMQVLQYDTTLYGQDKLDPITNEIETAHGPATQVINYDGTIDVIYPANTMNSMNNWANTYSSSTYSPGAGSAPASSGAGQQGGQGGGQQGMQQAQQMMSMMQQMFGQSSKIMQEMFKRLAPQQEKESKKMHEKLNKGKKAQKLNDIFKATAEGGEPLSKSNYDSGMGGGTDTGFDLQFNFGE